MWFGTYSCLGARMRTRGLVRPLFVAKTTWFGISDFCNGEEEWVGHGVKDHEGCDDKTYQWALDWRKSQCGILSHLFQKACASWEVWLGWDRVTSPLRCQSLLLKVLVGRRTYGCWFGLLRMY